MPNACIVGIGCSRFGEGLPESQVALGAAALKAALADAGLSRDDIDGLSLNYGGPLGVDYDRLAGAFGIDARYINQTWLNGRFITTTLMHAAWAVQAGAADVVACVTAVSFSRIRERLGNVLTDEVTREEGGTHGEAPAYGLTSPAGGAALALQRYLHQYAVDPALLAAVPIAQRAHAALNPGAIKRTPITVDDYARSRLIADPLRVLDCCLVSDGAVVILVTSEERARDLRQSAVAIRGSQGLRAGREEFVFAPRGLGFGQQSGRPGPAREEDLAIFDAAGVRRDDVQGFYVYDAFSPLVVYALERFGYCGPGEGPDFVQGGRIGPGGALPVNTSGGLLSEAHVAGWNSIAEMVRQLRGQAGDRQIPDARVLQWGTAWGDSIILSTL
ncbi:MAG TPA: thiolase family protein [Caulobacteraceae bacterium]|nr:thiolase family protein [Caulobacteraceae bacterium]